MFEKKLRLRLFPLERESWPTATSDGSKEKTSSKKWSPAMRVSCTVVLLCHVNNPEDVCSYWRKQSQCSEISQMYLGFDDRTAFVIVI